MRKLLICLFFLSGLAVADDRRALSFEDFFTMRRLTNISVAPDGRSVLYRIQQANLDKNSFSGTIFLLDVATGQSKRMSAEGENCSSPVFAPDGKAYAYVTGGQVWIKAFDGSAPRKITDAPEGAGGPVFSPDGKWLIYSSTVARDQTPKAHSGRLIDRLMFRQWNEWRDNTRNHLFLVATAGPAAAGKDLTPGDFDAPPLDLGSPADFTFSPDGMEVAYVKNTDPVVATSTNNDIFVLDLASGQERRISTSEGSDSEPKYSPDGRFIAFTSMARKGFEADRHVLCLFDRKSGQIKALSAAEDLDTGNLAWASDSKRLYFSAQVTGDESLFQIDLEGKVKRLTQGFGDGFPQLDGIGKTLFFTREATNAPRDLHALDLATGQIRRLTSLNAEVLGQLAMNPWEPFWFDSPDGVDKVQGFMVKPPFFDANKKYPMIYLIHGGPQGMWENEFHYRWNAQMFAARGYAVVLVNPHGSKGYGQKFCDAVSGDWGGLPYQDLMKGVDEAVKRYPFIDANRIAAAGASYGGYMINWILGQPSHPFKAMVSHNGVFNLPSMGLCTEELWFSEWEFGGTYFERPELYEKWSPHRLIANFRTPTLVVHSELDYRVPLNQGIELFTALQRKGIPSKWLYFPDEDHFVSKPQNAKMWWHTVQGWIDQWLENGEIPKAQGS